MVVPWWNGAEPGGEGSVVASTEEHGYPGQDSEDGVGVLPEGVPAMLVRDRLGELFEDEEFTEFPSS